jgi:hypothetical protein
MRISGFTFARNASKLYYPVKAAISSILPLVDEFVVALGDNDPDDTTEQEILSINSPKIKIIRTVWDLENFPHGMEYARQTDIAMKACTGDWLFYIQSDEVLHEKYFPVVKEACAKYLDQPSVDGFLFSYRHFWGDYNHYVVSHAWYPREIRIVRNSPEFHSWRDAQSFRRIPDFDGKDYYQKKGTSKLHVVPIDACIHHYGFVRPPAIMQRKNKNHHANYRGLKAMIERFKNRPDQFEYGDLSKLQLYKDEHPKVMKEWIAKMDWGHILQLPHSKNAQHKHDLPKYKLLTFIEQRFLRGRQLFGFRNYKLAKRKIFPSGFFG